MNHDVYIIMIGTLNPQSATAKTKASSIENGIEKQPLRCQFLLTEQTKTIKAIALGTTLKKSKSEKWKEKVR